MKSPFERDSGQTKTPTDAVTMICEPWLRMWTRGNADMMTLASQRARAYMELPGRLGACHSPADVVREQMHFWQTAAEQYQRCCTDIARVAELPVAAVAAATGERESTATDDVAALPEARDRPAAPWQHERRH